MSDDAKLQITHDILYSVDRLSRLSAMHTVALASGDEQEQSEYADAMGEERAVIEARLAALTAEVERLKGEAEEARANLLLQTICRLPSVLTTDDWQDYLDEHRHEWLNDDRAFGGWVSQRLSVAIATARADALREIREKVEKLPRHSVVDAGGDEYDNGSFDMWKCGEVLALLDAPRGDA